MLSVINGLRSEEHTSELQSRGHLVCRLLLDTSPTKFYPLSLHDALPIYNDCIVLNKSIPFFEGGKPHLKGTKTNERERIIYMPKWYMKELKKFKEFWDEEKYAVGDKWIEIGRAHV